MTIYRILSTVLLCAVLMGCSKAPPMDLQQEYNEKFTTVPALPGSQELGRKFTYSEGHWYLRVTVSISDYPFREYDDLRSWGGGIWTYDGSNGETGDHWYVTNGWLLTVKRGPRAGQATLALRRDP